MTAGRLDSARAAFVLAGRTIFTLVSSKTGQRFTFRVRAPRQDSRVDYDADVRFVDVLVGPDNSSDYRYLGAIRGGVFVVGRKSAVGADAPSAKAFAWFWSHVDDPRVEVWHAGRCGRCGRQLTVPESVALGLGPECSGRAA